MIADQLSRPNQPITIEWSLHPEVVNLLFKLWGTPVVDMFATVHNTHLPQFVSSSGATSTGDRCSVTAWTGRDGQCTCFHCFPCSTESFRSSGQSRRAGDTHSHLVTITTVVSTLATTVCGPPRLFNFPTGKFGAPY